MSIHDITDLEMHPLKNDGILRYRDRFPNGPLGELTLHILGEQNERKAKGTKTSRRVNNIYKKTKPDARFKESLFILAVFQDFKLQLPDDF